MPKIAVPTASMIRYAPVRLRLRSSRIGSSAWRLRVSMTANAASSTTAAASDGDHLGVAPVRDAVRAGGGAGQAVDQRGESQRCR